MILQKNWNESQPAGHLTFRVVGPSNSGEDATVFAAMCLSVRSIGLKRSFTLVISL